MEQDNETPVEPVEEKSKRQKVIDSLSEAIVAMSDAKHYTAGIDNLGTYSIRRAIEELLFAQGFFYGRKEEI